ncbi:helix-turn-helix domain-containing protein [Chloroflexota bacterium]
MARKAIVDKDIILSMLNEGETTQRIADKFNVSRQAVDIYRRDFIKNGLLPNQRAVRTSKAPKEAVPTKQNIIMPKEYPPSKDTVALDKQIDLIIDAFHALKRLPQLEKEVDTYKHEYENALQEIERLKENEKKRLDQESRWLNAHRQSDTSSA